LVVMVALEVAVAQVGTNRTFAQDGSTFGTFTMDYCRHFNLHKVLHVATCAGSALRTARNMLGRFIASHSRALARAVRIAELSLVVNRQPGNATYPVTHPIRWICLRSIPLGCIRLNHYAWD
ncbi:hypothetical protein LCGC14_1540860, partial [marine sediment metagenome]